MKLVRTEPAQAEVLRGYFASVGFTSSELPERIGTADPPAPEASDRLVWACREQGALGDLVTLFLCGRPISADDAGLPAEIVSALEQLGLLARLAGELVPHCLFVPYEGIWLASDLFRPIERGEDAGEFVLSTGSVPRRLSSVTIRKPVGRLLDLCGGNGIQGLIAAAHADEVVITDLNERAIEYARFNAAFAGIDNVDFRVGSMFEPVAGERFDQIVCNPPFVLSPKGQLMAFDNGMELDGFCRDLLARVPEFLAPGASFQMIFEWVELEGEPWTRRLEGWFEGAPVDVWIVKENTKRPDRYAAERIRELGQVLASNESFADWMELYDRQRVRAIHGGFLVVRPSTGRSRVRFDELSGAWPGPVGSHVEAALARFAFLEEHSDETLLEQHLQLDPTVVLESEATQDGVDWLTRACRLNRTEGLPQVQTLQPSIAEFLRHFDGSRPLRAHIEELAQQAGSNFEALAPECQRIVRHMVGRGFLQPLA